MWAATDAARQSDCNRASVGCVIVAAGLVLARGANATIDGIPGCDRIGHLLRDGHCIRPIHAEASAIARCAAQGLCVQGATMYVTHLPCYTCYKLAVMAGIRRIVYGEDYHDQATLEADARLHLLAHVRWGNA